MTSSELGTAMEGQVAQVGLEFETGLSNAILSEVEHEPGAMPLLQYALRELWNRRRGRQLCYDEYNKIERVKKAIATTATNFFEQLAEYEQHHVRYIFEQLIHIDEDFNLLMNGKQEAKDTRRRVTLNQLVTKKYDLNQTKTLLAKLANVRLVITNGDKPKVFHSNDDLIIIAGSEVEVEVAHEALIIHWDQLKNWISESRPRLKLQQQLRPRVKHWREIQNDGVLLRSIEGLPTLKKYLDDVPDVFNQDEKEFIQASYDLPHRKPSFYFVLMTAFSVATAVSIIRILGIMQPLELAAYDQMMRLKPSEEKDHRILVVGVSESDIQSKVSGTGVGQGTVRDFPLQKLLMNLQKHKPRVIALDMPRDRQSDLPALGNELNRDNLIGICISAYENEHRKNVQDVRVKPTFEIEKNRVEEHIGFSNFFETPIIPVRIQPLIETKPDPVCIAKQSFSYAIANLYLKNEKNYNKKEVRVVNGDYIVNLQWGDIQIPELTGLAGGYQGDPSKNTLYKILLNYRSYQGDPSKFANKVSLQDILDNKVSKEEIENKIIMIGIDSENSGDYISTPYGIISGPIVHSQMASQIVSLALDKRPLIWWWSVWIDIGWIGVWSSVGGITIWRIREPVQWIIIDGVSVMILTGTCWVVFACQAGWIPLVPPIFALSITSMVLAGETFNLRQDKTKSWIYRFESLRFIPIKRLRNIFRKYFIKSK